VSGRGIVRERENFKKIENGRGRGRVGERERKSEREGEYRKKYQKEERNSARK
jgi:hypothetical protein